MNILSNLSSEEAKLLLKLNPIDKLGKDFSAYLGSPRDAFKNYVLKNYDTNLNPWTYSCNVLLDFDLAEVIAPKKDIYDSQDQVTILYITQSGIRFLNAVTLK